MKAYLINMHLLVPTSRSSAKVKVKYKGYISQKNGRFGGIHVSQTHLVFHVFKCNLNSLNSLNCFNCPNVYAEHKLDGDKIVRLCWVRSENVRKGRKCLPPAILKIISKASFLGVI